MFFVSKINLVLLLTNYAVRGCSIGVFAYLMIFLRLDLFISFVVVVMLLSLLY
jgi:hypothetical protein